jgi:hypothetical protein
LHIAPAGDATKEGESPLSLHRHLWPSGWVIHEVSGARALVLAGSAGEGPDADTQTSRRACEFGLLRLEAIEPEHAGHEYED